MKILTLTSPTPKNETVQLDIVSDRTCNFCGEAHVLVVQGLLPLEVSTPQTETMFVLNDPEMVLPTLGKPYYKAESGNHRYIVNYEKDLSVKKDHADICIPCIRQLANLTKDMKVE